MKIDIKKIGAVVAVAGSLVGAVYWLSSALTAPERITAAELKIYDLEKKQIAVESKIDLIYGDVRDIKNFLIRARISKND